MVTDLKSCISSKAEASYSKRICAFYKKWSSKNWVNLHNLAILQGSGHLNDRISLNTKKSVLTVSGLTSLNTKIIYVYVTRIGAQVMDCISSLLQGNNPVNPVEHVIVKVLCGLVRALLSMGLLNRVLNQCCCFCYWKLTELWARVGKLSLTSMTFTLQLQRDDIPSAAPSRSDAFTTRV